MPKDRLIHHQLPKTFSIILSMFLLWMHLAWANDSLSPRTNITKIKEKKPYTVLERIPYALFHMKGPPKIIVAHLDDLSHPIKHKPLKLALIRARTNSYNIRDIHSVIMTAISTDQYDIIVAPEYSYHSRSILKESEKNRYLEDIIKATKGKEALVIPGSFVWQTNGKMYNTAYAVYNGEIIHTYNKINDGGERDDIAPKFDLWYIPGQELGIFNWGNLRVGIEICRDVGIISSRGVGGLDILFLVSCCDEVLTPVTNCIRPGGYVIANDGYNGYVLVGSKPSGECDLYL